MAQPHERLDDVMNQRRLALRMNWREVSQAAGISYEALRGIRRGDYRPTELTARGIDLALQWTPGSTLTVLHGGRPTCLEDAPATGDVPEEPPSTELTAELRLAERLFSSTIRELRLSPSEADEVWRRVRLDIERAHTGTDDDQAGRSSDQGHAM
ncbi:hypothetical protein AB0F46_01870 [Streptomyces sp. NPDC026665]|uniref:hypothetical protein n=1 Tax=Streptomyces sp. NPDC026665 TaxID=3154798 RepID=UPI0033D396E4